MSFTELSMQNRNRLKTLARESIAYGLNHHQAVPVDLATCSQALQEQGASFVTLLLNQQLRGCIGTLSAYQPLAQDVAEHAYAAAFNDPRFKPVSREEAEQLEIKVSILNPAKEMCFSSEEDLLSQLQPNIDGLILHYKNHQATFLPSVWQQLATPQDFLNHLKQKAGLTINDWSQDMKISRYTTTSF